MMLKTGLLVRQGHPKCHL